MKTAILTLLGLLLLPACGLAQYRSSAIERREFRRFVAIDPAFHANFGAYAAGDGCGGIAPNFLPSLATGYATSFGGYASGFGFGGRVIDNWDFFGPRFLPFGIGHPLARTAHFARPTWGW